MMVPTIHLNGTSREELRRQFVAANEALRQAHAALCKASPHGRDYYPQGPNAIDQAVREHRARLSAINQIMAELNEIGMALL